MPECAGCGAGVAEMQCPLCQAAEIDGGFFCGQECFSKNFLKHRDSAHKSGTVKAKRTQAEKVAAAAEESRKKRDRKRALDVTAPTSAKAADAEAEALEDLDFSDSEEGDAVREVVEKELQKRKELSCWPMWPGVDVTGDALAFATSSSPAASKRAPPLAVIQLDGAGATAASSSGAKDVRRSPRKSAAKPQGTSWTRSDIATSSENVADCFHSAALFAVQTASNWINARGDGNGKRGVVIVAGGPTMVHACAWAARCRDIQCVPVAGTTRQPAQVLADFTSTQRQIAIVSYPALSDSDSEAAASTSAWLGAVASVSDAAKPLLITLPDLPCSPEDLQCLTAPSVFIRAPSACAADFRVGGKVAAAIPKLAAEQPVTASDFEPVGARYDATISAALVARGDLVQTVNLIARLYSESKPRAEDALIGVLMADWGSESAVHQHHKLAVVLRMLVDTSIKMATSEKVKDQQSLAYMAARCVGRAAKHLPRIEADDWKSAGSPCPFIYLDATIAYCFSRIPHSITDELAELWGIHTLGIPANLAHADRMRTVALHKLRSIFQPRLGVVGATFAGVLHHCIADASIRHALNVKEVRAATLWDWVCVPFGDLPAYLLASCLVHRPEDLTDKRGVTREGVKVSKTARNRKPSGDALFVTDATAVQQHPTQTCPKLRRVQWPLLGARKRRRELMVQAALEELQSALPSSSKVPIYLGDIGQLIGKWTTFNNRFGGYLPPTLQKFIEMFPGEFRIVGNVVTRVKDSKTQQIKLRFDDPNEQGYDSDDEDARRERKRNRAEGNKKISNADIKTRRGLKAAEKKLVESKSLNKRAVKRKMRSLRNKARFNKNRKSVDQSAKVPGFNKPQPKAIKGRGRKANARTWKRD